MLIQPAEKQLYVQNDKATGNSCTRAETGNRVTARVAWNQAEAEQETTVSLYLSLVVLAGGAFCHLISGAVRTGSTTLHLEVCSVQLICHCSAALGSGSRVQVAEQGSWRFP